MNNTRICISLMDDDDIRNSDNADKDTGIGHDYSILYINYTVSIEVSSLEKVNQLIEAVKEIQTILK